MADTPLPSLDRDDLTLPSAINAGIIAFGVIIALWIIYWGLNRPMPRTQHANLVLGGGLGIFYFDQARRKLLADRDDLRHRLTIGMLFVFGIAMLASAAYVHVSFLRWREFGMIYQYSALDLAVGTVIVFLVTESTFRAYGKTLGGVVVVGMLFGLVGGHLPGILGHQGLDFERLVYRQTIALEGVYGILLDLGATWIAIFVVMAGVIEEHGGFDYILEIGKKVADKSRSGVAQSAVISSMIIGSMMGGAAANVATTGSFTIPLMKRNEIPGRFAGAAESMASTGGQIMPPIMSIAAFLMADFTGVPYATVAIAGVIPAILFYMTVALSIHYAVVLNGWGKAAAEIEIETPSESRGDFYLKTAQYSIPLIVLVYYLMVKQFPIMLVGLYTIASFLLARGLYQLYMRDPVDYILTTFKGLGTGMRNLAPYMAILGSLGIIIDVMTFSGLANKIAIWIVLSSGGTFLVVLILSMVVSIIFGLGMPTPAAYIVVALIIAPALVDIGLQTLPAHFYVLYFAVFSAITPPVAVAVAVAAGIAEVDFLSTAKETLKLGAPVYLIPFFFVMNPEIMYWEFPITAIKFGVFLLAMYALVNTVIGFNGIRRISIPERGIQFALSLVMAFAPQTSVQVGAAAVFIVLAALSLQFSDQLGRVLGGSRY